MPFDKNQGLLFKLLIPFVLFVDMTIRASTGHCGSLFEDLPVVEIHGFFETRAGFRMQNDPHERDLSILDARLQGELLVDTDWAEFKYKGDLWYDGVTEQGEYDTRETWFFVRPTDFLDVKIGRQVLTWGTGELVFLNDLFPKDWQSFFIGRDSEYLKAPSDAAKFSFFTDIANLDVVYTPQFDPDRLVTGEYLSYWNASLGKLAGRDAIVKAEKPERWFQDDEVSVRLYKNINNYEAGLYGYRGYWKKPAGRTESGRPAFPELDVFGASVRGRIGPGIGNIEIAYYHSADDESGSNPLVDNSEMRYLAGYTQDMGRDFNAGLQYYVEQILDYDDYVSSLTEGPVRDRFRHVLTFRFTKLLMSQNLELSLEGYYSHSDHDAYLRPKVHYKYTDHIAIETGANLFVGADRNTFFGQFEKNTNTYMAVRYSF